MCFQMEGMYIELWLKSYQHLCEAKLKHDNLIYLVEDILRQHSIHATQVHWELPLGRHTVRTGDTNQNKNI